MLPVEKKRVAGMIVGVGIDIIEIDRVAAAVERDSFVRRVFADEEQAYCDSRGVHRAASYAARFAAKEATVKALGTGFSGGSWREVYVVLDEKGKPHVRLRGYYADLARSLGVSAIHVSLTHARDYAAAQVIMWGGADDETGHGSPDAGN